MRFGHVPPPFGALWPDIVTLLDKAVSKGGNRWADVKADLASGRAQLWLTVCPLKSSGDLLNKEIDQKTEWTPINATVSRMDGRTVEIWLCGGAVLSGALPFLETILAAARSDGATDARICGRKGWQRALAPFGWRKAGDELVKDLAA